MVKHRFKAKNFLVRPGDKLSLADIRTGPGDELTSEDQALSAMAEDLKYLQVSQEKLYAEDRQSLVIIFQGMDAAGKDGCIRHVFSGINPQGCVAHSFRAPNDEELQHHYLWRPMRFLPARGKIAIFNRSYYEEVLVVRVHPEFLARQRLPDIESTDELWPMRFKEIKSFEKMLTSHGTHVIKFMLHVSQEVQIKRLVERLENRKKHWKVNLRDFDERQLWPEYQTAFEEMMSATSSDAAPWYVIPADEKWYARAVVADLVAQHLEGMRVAYPTVPNELSDKYAALATQFAESAGMATPSSAAGEERKLSKRDKKRKKSK
jgi:PPK2 family polyphosphate:nucleotide phosphotransferase